TDRMLNRVSGADICSSPRIDAWVLVLRPICADRSLRPLHVRPRLGVSRLALAVHKDYEPILRTATCHGPNTLLSGAAKRRFSAATGGGARMENGAFWCVGARFELNIDLRMRAGAPLCRPGCGRGDSKDQPGQLSRLLASDHEPHTTS